MGTLKMKMLKNVTKMLKLSHTIPILLLFIKKLSLSFTVLSI